MKWLSGSSSSVLNYVLANKSAISSTRLNEGVGPDRDYQHMNRGKECVGSILSTFPNHPVGLPELRVRFQAGRIRINLVLIPDFLAGLQSHYTQSHTSQMYIVGRGVHCVRRHLQSLPKMFHCLLMHHELDLQASGDLVLHCPTNCTSLHSPPQDRPTAR